MMDVIIHSPDSIRDQQLSGTQRALFNAARAALRSSHYWACSGPAGPALHC